MASDGWTGGRALRTLAGGVLGTAAGILMAVGVIVARARFEARYMESTREMIGWPLVMIGVGVVGGLLVGASRQRILGAAAAGLLAGALLGALAGLLLSLAVSREPVDHWSGGTIGAAVGLFLGAMAGALVGRRRRGTLARDSALAAASLLPAALLGGCAAEVPDLPEVPPAPAEPAAGAESVVFLLGDPGKARYSHYPVLPRLAGEVEAWSERLGSEGRVVVVVLGDVVYPDGLNPPGTEEFGTDSARVASQVDVVRGAAAQRHGARMYFVAGNHDWGMEVRREGVARLRNLGAFLDRVRARGPWVDLAPDAGRGGPVVVDVGAHLRLLLLDTAWWLLDAEPAGKARVVEEVGRAIAGAGDRAVVVAAHHPYETAGPHGGLIPVWSTLGVRHLLTRSGAMLQDLESRPYRDLRRALARVFAAHGRPLLFAGGHEHSLQVVRGQEPGTPRFSAVSGSASKLTGVGHVPGMLFRRSEPGYLRVVTRADGSVDLYAEAAPARFLSCPDDGTAALPWERCMEQGVEAYRTVFSMRLRGPAAPGP